MDKCTVLLLELSKPLAEYQNLILKTLNRNDDFWAMSRVINRYQQTYKRNNIRMKLLFMYLSRTAMFYCHLQMIINYTHRKVLEGAKKLMHNRNITFIEDLPFDAKN